MCFFAFIWSTLLWKKTWVDPCISKTEERNLMENSQLGAAVPQSLKSTWSFSPACLCGCSSALKCSSRALHKPHLQNVSSFIWRVDVKARFVFWCVFPQNKSTFGNVVSNIFKTRWNFQNLLFFAMIGCIYLLRKGFDFWWFCVTFKHLECECSSI